MAGPVGAIFDKLGGSAIGAMLSPVEKSLSYRANRDCPVEIPGVGEIWDLYNRLYANRTWTSVMLRNHGIWWNPDSPQRSILEENDGKAISEYWESQRLAQSEQPSISDLLDLFRRGWVDSPDSRAHWLARAGVFDPAAQSLILNLMDEMPTISDIIHFSVKDVWVPEVVTRYQYDAEMPKEYGEWFRKVAGDLPFGDIGSKQKEMRDLTLPLAHWRAHWDLMSPSQAFEAFRRVRLSRLDRIKETFDKQIEEWRKKYPRESDQYIKPFQNIEAFNIHDLGLHLRVANYAPTSRPWLAAIAYHPLTRVDVRRMRQLGVISTEEVYECYLDLGYDPTNARYLQQFTERSITDSLLKRDRDKAVKGIVDAYVMGVIDRDAALQAGVKASGGSGKGDERDKQLSLVMSIKLDAADVARKAQRLKSIIASVRRRFLRAHLDRDGVQNYLQAAGLQQPVIEQYLRDWMLEMDSVRRELTTAQILKYYEMGLITPGSMEMRLERLGWNAEDAEILRLSADHKIDEKRQKAQAKASKVQDGRKRRQQTPAAAGAIAAVAGGTAANQPPPQAAENQP